MFPHCKSFELGVTIFIVINFLFSKYLNISFGLLFYTQRSIKSTTSQETEATGLRCPAHIN